MGGELPDINKTPTEQTSRRRAKTRRSPVPRSRSRGSEDHGLPDPPPGALVQVLRWRRKPDLQGSGPADAGAVKTVDEEISAKVIDFLDRNDPKKTNKPFFVWYNPARMHIDHAARTPKYMAMVGEPGGKDWGVNEAGMKQMDDNIGVVSKSWKIWASSTTPSSPSPPTTAPRPITFPDGGTTPFKGRKLSTWEGGMRAPMVIRWPGRQAGHGQGEIILDWLPTFVNIAGGPRATSSSRSRPASTRDRQDHARRDGSARLSEGKTEKSSARDTFFYYSGAAPSAVRYKNWKMYFTMVSDSPAGFLAALPITGPRSSTSSATLSRRPSVRSTRPSSVWAALWRTGDRLCLRLEHAAHRPGAVAEGTRATFRSRRCRIGNLQPGTGPRADQEGEDGWSSD